MVDESFMIRVSTTMMSVELILVSLFCGDDEFIDPNY